MNQTAVIPDAKSTDPFFYGYRDVERRLPDGTVEYDIEPLTLEDVIHPQFGDHIVLNTFHDLLCDYLKIHLRERVKDDKSAQVFHDVGIFWGDEELRHHSPDISVIFGVREHDGYWSSFQVADEGVRPSLLIEVVSPSTREADFGRKIDHYYRAGVPQYVIVDCKDGLPTRLLSYQSAPGGYILDEPHEYGRVLLDCVNLWLEIRDQWLVLVDAETGENLKDSKELVRLAEEARLNTERTAREEARQAAELLRSSEQARLDAERIAREEARRAAELLRLEKEARLNAERIAREEARQAQQQATRAAAAEQRLREMEDEIRKLRGNG